MPTQTECQANTPVLELKNVAARADTVGEKGLESSVTLYRFCASETVSPNSSNRSFKNAQDQRYHSMQSERNLEYPQR